MCGVQEKQEGQSGHEDEEDDSSSCLVAVRMLSERWGPPSGRGKFSQRVFRVEFSDGSVQTLVAEDIQDPLPHDVPLEQNEFYTDVLRAWRVLHPSVPTRPNSAL